MNILLSYASIPVTTAVYLEKAMRRSCGVITHGPTISREILEQWDLLAVEKKVKNLQIPFLNGDMEDVLDQLPVGWGPDLFLYVDTGLFYPLKNMRALNCLKACYLIDSHVAFDLHLKFAENYDIVFAAHKPAVEMFKEKGIKNVFWIPPACDPTLHEKKAGEKKYDVGFVGSSNPERVHLLNELGQRFNTYYERCFLERMAEVLSQSKIVFNKSIEGGLNMRVFEALASGSMLLTNEADGSGLQDFFQDRKHLVIYRNENELFELADYYLRNDNEREEIAFEGMSKALSEHTYSNRVKDMVKIISTFMG
ncbi:MAG: glycosyltransferase [Candidatus Scalindua rubra]|nr:glycosyltransferase [Candidatus Scalindua rubra]TWU29220.1 Spore protein YkvP [Candidatus Brocadiaceae bacterium S225]